MSKRSRTLVTLVLVLVVLAACRTPIANDHISSRDLAAISAATGAVSLTLVPDPDSPSLQLGPGEEYVPPQLDPSNAPPAYPAELVPLRLEPQTVILRITFDERGRVLQVARSPLQKSAAGGDLVPFERAAIEGMSDWKCWPPRIRKFRPGPDIDGDGQPDYRILADQRILKTFFDVSFTFEVVDGVPVVKRAGSE